MKGQNFKARTPAQYIAALDEPRRSEVRAMHALIRRVAPKLKPCILMGGLAYGPFHYRYASGREGDSCKIGIASNAQAISLYVCAGDPQGSLVERYAKQLGKASCGRSCVRFKRMSDLNPDVLEQLIREAAAWNYAP